METEFQTLPAEALRSAMQPSAESGSEMAFLALLRRQGKPLDGLTREFNLYPIRYAHPSWIPNGWDRAKALCGQVPGRPEVRLSIKLLLHWDLADQTCFSFGEVSRRIALADPATLERTAFLGGLAVHWESISRILEREAVQEIRGEIGTEAYRFSLFRAPILVGNPPVVSGIAIGERGFTGITERMRRIGLELIADCMAGSPRALRARLALKFPREFADLFLADHPGSANARIWRLVKSILIQEVDPSWEPLLT